MSLFRVKLYARSVAVLASLYGTESPKFVSRSDITKMVSYPVLEIGYFDSGSFTIKSSAIKSQGFCGTASDCSSPYGLCLAASLRMQVSYQSITA